MGVWIETCGLYCALNDKQSHPVWVCGLKLTGYFFIRTISESHPVWVCGLKLKSANVLSNSIGHTLYGCVD